MPQRGAETPWRNWLCLAVVLGCSPASALPLAGSEALPEKGAARDWKAAPAILEITTPEDVYALGDVHGDYERLVKLLAAGKILAKVPDRPEEAPWNAGKAVLVCTGDLINKGEASVKVVTFVRALQEAARKAGGQVIVTMGNHEAEFLADPTSTKVQDFAQELTAAGIKPGDVAAGRDAGGIGRFLRSLPLAARVNAWFFAHAGDTRGRSLEQLRMELQEEIDNRGYHIHEANPALVGLLDARLHPFPWWQKEEKEDPKTSRESLEKNVRALGVKHQVIGHQNNKVVFSDGTRRERGKVFQKFDGLIFFIDVGMSRSIDRSKGALLRIHQGKKVKTTLIQHDGATEKFWSE